MEIVAPVCGSVNSFFFCNQIVPILLLLFFHAKLL